MLKRHISLILLAILLTACSREKTTDVQGYIEGRYTYMSTPVSGTLDKLLVARGASVKAGDLLFTLALQPEADQYESTLQKLKQQQAAREGAAAELDYAEKTYKRYQVLVPKKAIQESQLDQSKAQYESDLAKVHLIEADILGATADAKQAKWLLDQKSVAAPIDSRVFDTYYRMGEFTVANMPILALLAPADIKAIFYVPESTLSQIQLNDEITVNCDGCEKTIAAHVSFISPIAEYTPPVIFSNDTNVKLVYRVEAEFSPEDAVTLHPGQPIRVQVKTHG